MSVPHNWFHCSSTPLKVLSARHHAWTSSGQKYMGNHVGAFTAPMPSPFHPTAAPEPSSGVLPTSYRFQLPSSVGQGPSHQHRIPVSFCPAEQRLTPSLFPLCNRVGIPTALTSGTRPCSHWVSPQPRTWWGRAAPQNHADPTAPSAPGGRTTPSHGADCPPQPQGPVSPGQEALTPIAP